MPISENPAFGLDIVSEPVALEARYPSGDVPGQRNELREKSFGAEMKLKRALGIAKVLDQESLEAFFRRLQLSGNASLVFSVNSSTFRLRRIQLGFELVGIDLKTASWDLQRAYVLERHLYQEDGNIPEDSSPIEASRIDVSHQTPHIYYFGEGRIPHEDSKYAKEGFDGILRVIEQRPRRPWDYGLRGTK